METWRDIPGWEGYYQVSNQGRVKSLARTITKSNGRTQRTKGTILKPGVMQNGYLLVALTRDNRKVPRTVHKLVARVFHGEPLLGQQVRHLDGSRDNNHADNLCWGTDVENKADAETHGTRVKGWASGRAKLTEREALDIRTDPRSMDVIAAAYDVTRSNVSCIKRRVSWRHLP